MLPFPYESYFALFECTFPMPKQIVLLQPLRTYFAICRRRARQYVVPAKPVKQVKIKEAIAIAVSRLGHITHQRIDRVYFCELLVHHAPGYIVGDVCLCVCLHIVCVVLPSVLINEQLLRFRADCFSNTWVGLVMVCRCGRGGRGGQDIKTKFRPGPNYLGMIPLGSDIFYAWCVGGGEWEHYARC